VYSSKYSSAETTTDILYRLYSSYSIPVVEELEIHITMEVIPELRN
jgi:hypothetical protein